MEGASGHVQGVKMYLCGDFAFGEWRAGVDAVGCKRGSPGAKESAVCELRSPPVTGLSAFSVGIFTSAVDEAAGVGSGIGPRPLQRLPACSARPKASRMGFAIRDGEVMEEDCEKICVTEVVGRGRERNLSHVAGCGKSDPDRARGRRSDQAECLVDESFLFVLARWTEPETDLIGRVG